MNYNYLQQIVQVCHNFHSKNIKPFTFKPSATTRIQAATFNFCLASDKTNAMTARSQRVSAAASCEHAWVDATQRVLHAYRARQGDALSVQRADGGHSTLQLNNKVLLSLWLPRSHWRRRLLWTKKMRFCQVNMRCSYYEFVVVESKTVHFGIGQCLKVENVHQQRRRRTQTLKNKNRHMYLMPALTALAPPLPRMQRRGCVKKSKHCGYSML